MKIEITPELIELVELIHYKQIMKQKQKILPIARNALNARLLYLSEVVTEQISSAGKA